MNESRKTFEVNQRAERDLYNVNGNLIVKNYISSESGDLIVELKQFNEDGLINYYEITKSKLSQQKQISRPHIKNAIRELLNSTDKLKIYGEPGIGKTSLLISLTDRDNTIYLSLKKFSSIKSLLYLINMTRKKAGLELIFSEDLDFLVVEFEYLLQTTKFIFLIDDVEKDQKLVQTLLNIEVFENKFIFIARSKNELLFNEPIKEYQVPRFNDSEVKLLLEINNFESSITNLVEIINLSKGNPLYISYFIDLPVFPIPTGLESYLRALYESLDEISKITLNVLSLSYESINRMDLLDIVNKISEEQINPYNFNKVLKSLNKFIEINGSEVEIDHPYFLEFVRNTLVSDGVLDWFKNEAGVILFEKKHFNKAVQLLLNTNDDLIKDVLIYVYPLYIETGQWDFAIEVILKAISYLKDSGSFEEAYNYYHLSNCYRLIGEFEFGKSSLEKAIELFTKLENEEWLLLCKVWLALDLAEDGEIDKSKQIHNEILKSSIENKPVEAALLFNVSKLYIDLYDFEEALKYVLKALDLFRKIGDKRGIKLSLVNISICLMKLDRLSEAVEYANTLLEISKEDNDLVVLGSALNTLTICNRLLKNLKEAESNGLECIKIWNKLKQKPKLLMNLVNLGNVYSDMRDYDKAIAVYREGLELAIALKMSKEEARAAELISHIFRIQGEYELAFEYIEIAKKASVDARDSYRLGEVYIEEALCYKAKGETVNAIVSYENAIKHYKEIKFKNEVLNTLVELVELWKFNGIDPKKIHSEIIKIIPEGLIDLNLDNSVYFLHLLEENISKEHLDEIVYSLAIYSTNSLNEITSNSILWIIEYCRKNCDKKLYLKIIDCFLESRNNYLNQVALLINQSSNLLNLEDMNLLISKLSIVLNNLYYREHSISEFIFTYKFLDKKMIQIHGDYSSIESLKIALFTVMITQINRDLFEDVIKDSLIESLTIYIITSEVIEPLDKSLYRNIEESPFPIIFAEVTGNDKFLPIIYRNNYEIENDLIVNRDNKVIVWLLMDLFSSIEAYFTNSNRDKIEYGKYRRTLTHRILNIFKVKEEDEILDFIKVPTARNLQKNYKEL
ncbi:hypothetical protein ABE61_05285 [Lysinibacillus sphaericus]|nr:tetratricopeptide repeat protein [Lysinibacillus sphaericus]MBG9453507.1 hypothetical protein [Lysinibacillus sphaericus]MBG9480350.1 hypothetical protein [Lysinibacillus sphaericus]MBG9595029.1 hypothetical protein [Lysinibacillus sphaericus]